MLDSMFVPILRAILRDKSKTFKNVTKMADYPGFTIIQKDNTVLLAEYTGSDEIVTIPEGVTHIGENLGVYMAPFLACKTMKSIKFPSSTTEICQWAFAQCTSLTSITIPPNIKNVLNGAFEYCTSLKTVVILNEDLSISNNAFGGCSGITIYGKAGSSARTLAQNLGCKFEAIGEWLDYEDFIISRIENRVILHKYIGSSEIVIIPDIVTEIDDNAFKDCPFVVSINFPKTITEIKDETFKNSSIKNITIPSSVTRIGNGAFRGCTSLVEIVIPENVVYLGQAVFLDCTSLKRAVFLNKIRQIPQYLFKNCTSLTSVTFPEGTGIEGVADCAMPNCTSLKTLTLPKSLKFIGWGMFEGCTSLTFMEIPENVHGIMSQAFKDCVSLKTVIITNPAVKFNDSVFENCPNLTIYSHAGSEVEQCTREMKIPFKELKEYSPDENQ